MAAYKDLTKEELLELKSGLQAQFEEVKARGLKLDMSEENRRDTAESVYGDDEHFKQWNRSCL